MKEILKTTQTHRNEKNPLLNDEWIEEEIKKDIWNFLEPYENEKKPPKSLRHIETVLREKLITLSAHIKKNQEEHQ